MFTKNTAGVFVSLVFGALLVTSSAFADDRCSLSEVIQPAIDAAAVAASCNTDGTYVSPQLLAEKVKNECGSITDSRKCKICLITASARVLVTARTLVREGFLSTGATLVTAKEIYNLRDQLCK